MTQEWQSCRTGQYPNGMVQAGTDDDGSAIFVGRAFFQNDLLPAKVIPSKNAAYVSHNGGEHFVDEFQVLRTITYIWRAGAHGSVPVGAVSVGHTSDGEPLYMGRANHEGTLTPGKIHTTHRCLYIPFNGQEVSVSEYEVLCAE